MKKVLFTLAIAFATFTASAQITTVASSKTIAMYDSKDVWLNMTIGADGDTTYAIRLRSTYAYNNTAEVLTGAKEKSHVLVDLGKREQAVAILRSMIDFKGESNTLVTLNNPSENAAVYSDGIMGKGFIVADRWNVEKIFVKSATLEKVLADIQSVKPGMEFEDQVAKKQEQATTGLIVGLVVGIGIAAYFIIKAMSLSN